MPEKKINSKKNIQKNTKYTKTLKWNKLNILAEFKEDTDIVDLVLSNRWINIDKKFR